MSYPPTHHTPYYARDGGMRGHRGAHKSGSPGSDLSARGEMPPQSSNKNYMSPFSYADSNNTQDSSLLVSPENYKPAAHGFSNASRPTNSGVGNYSDPFAPSQPKITSLNAAASAFQPSVSKGCGDSESNMSQARPTGEHEQFVSNYLNNVIVENSQRAVEPQLVRSGTLTQESEVSRAIKVDCTAMGSVVEGVLSYLKLMNHAFDGTHTYHQVSNKLLFIRHSNISDAIAVYEVLKGAPELGDVSYHSTRALRDMIPQYVGCDSDYEGQIFVKVKYPLNARNGIAKHAFEAKVREQVKSHGSIKAFSTLPTPRGEEMLLLAEFYDADRVPRALRRLDGGRVDNSRMSAWSHHPDVPYNPYEYLPVSDGAEPTGSASQGHGYRSGGTSHFRGTHSTSTYTGAPSHAGGQGNGHSHDNGMHGFTQQPMPLIYPNGQPMLGLAHPQNGGLVPYNQQILVVTPMQPSQYNMSGYGYDYDQYGNQGYSRGRGRGNYYNRGYYSHRHMIGHPDHESKKGENIVKIERISAGLDVRTTVMLRNIPNKMDQVTLKKIVDETSKNKYDFMYLRIDFSNDCNVGYAFINFLDPLEIIAFVRARANKRWDFYKSDKVAEVSYATIQGRDCLIQKFRNSSVMLEKAECRPKLFYPEGHPRAGQEEIFPCADNQSKLKRSCENAEHVGLFAPAAGQYYRNQQRYRQSQFDRGTSMAICEPGGFVGEFGFEVSSSDGGFGGPRGGRGGWRGGRGGPRGGFRGGYGGGSSFENFNGSQASAPHFY